MNTTQKVIKYIALALAIFLCVSIISSICGALGLAFHIFRGRDVVGEMKDYAISGKITELTVDLDAAQLNIQRGDAFLVQSNHKHLSVKESGGELNVSERSGIFSFSEAAQVTIFVPEDVTFQMVTIDTGAGNVRLEALSTDELDLDLGAGKTTIDDLTVYDVTEIDGGAGKLTITDSRLNDLHLDMGAGKLELTAAVTGDSSIDCGVGALELTLLGRESEYQIAMDKGIGSATLEGKSMQDDHIYGSGDNYLEIEGGVGSVQIQFQP